MNVEIGTEAAQFSEKEYINGIFFAVYISENQMTGQENNKLTSWSIRRLSYQTVTLPTNKSVY